MSNKLGISKRLASTQEFISVLKQRAQGVNGLLVYAEKNSVCNNRLGIIISKRKVSRATERNKLKRQIREAFRCNQTQGAQRYDFVVKLANNKTGNVFSDLSEFLLGFWAKDNDQDTTLGN